MKKLSDKDRLYCVLAVVESSILVANDLRQHGHGNLACRVEQVAAEFVEKYG